MKPVIRLTSDLAFMLPHARPNIPPVEYISDGVFLGYSEYLNTPVFLDLTKLIAPTGVFVGKIRTGKSTSAKAILLRQHLLYGTNLLIFDVHGEYSDLTRELGGTVIDMQKNTLNPCKLSPHLSNKQKALQLTDMLNTVFQFSDVQFATLLDYITKGYEIYGEHFTFDLLVKMIKDDFNKKTRDVVTLGAILRRIGILSGNVFGDENSIPLGHVTKGLVCIDVSKLDNNQLRNMTMLSILQHIYNTMLSDQSQQRFDLEGPIRLLIMIDEAGRIAGDPSSIATKLVKESGKFRIGLFFGIQDLPDIDSRIFSNYGFVVIHKLDNHEYITKIQQDCNFTPELASRIRSLPVGTAFLKLNFKDAFVQSPFIVRVVQEEILHSADKQNLALHMPAKPENEPSGRIRKDSETHKVNTLVQKQNTDLNENEFRLAQSIQKNPTFNVTEHYKNIGIDTYHGNIIRQSFESKGYIKGDYLKGKKSKRGRILELTEKGFERFRLQQNTKRFGGATHQIKIKTIADAVAALGHKVDTEKPIGYKKYADIVVDSTVAIEFDTRQLRKENITKYLDQEGFRKIIQVCNDKSQLENFKKQLEELELNDEEKKKVVIIDYDSFLDQEKIANLIGETVG